MRSPQTVLLKPGPPPSCDSMDRAVSALNDIMELHVCILQLEADLLAVQSAVGNLQQRLRNVPMAVATGRLVPDFQQDINSLIGQLQQSSVYIEELLEVRDRAFTAWARQHLGHVQPQ